MTQRKHRDLIIAWANGAQIQFLQRNSGIWQNVNNPSWDPNTEYRVKSEPKYRPYTYEEAQRAIGAAIKIKGKSHVSLITEVSNSNGEVYINGGTAYSILRNYEFPDGTPCGVLER